MIRRTVTHAFEGGHLHDLCIFLSERMLLERVPAVKLWSPQTRHDFLGYSDYPGLPDMVVRLHTGQTYVIEFETSPSKRVLEKKQYQFWRNGITDVITVDLSRFTATDNWRKLEKQLAEWLP